VGLTDGFENIRDHLQDIVESIWDAKKRRQLVFTSHNANLVVNGDAELVVYCDYKVHGEQSAGELKEQGAIDVRGEKAFKLRKEKCGF
jgi:type III restriction enzyme